MHPTPVSLLARLRQPNGDGAWGRFVTLYTPFFVHLLVNRLHVPHQDVGDVVQEIFVTLLQALPNFEYDPKIGSFRGYLCRVCSNKVNDRRRKKQMPAANEAALAGLADKRAEAELARVWEQDYNGFLVRRALEVMKAEFKPGTWKACWENVVNGRPAADVGKELGLSENAVFIAKLRVIRRLKEELEGLV